jgi:hypothetical protein
MVHGRFKPAFGIGAKGLACCEPEISRTKQANNNRQPENGALGASQTEQVDRLAAWFDNEEG